MKISINLSAFLSLLLLLTGCNDSATNPPAVSIGYSVATNQAALAEFSSRGITNQEEFIAGTDPTDAASFFLATDSGEVEGGFLIEWNTVSNRIYSVYKATSLTNSFQLLESGLAYPQSSYTDTNAVNNEKGYYRLKVQLQE